MDQLLVLLYIVVGMLVLPLGMLLYREAFHKDQGERQSEIKRIGKVGKVVVLIRNGKILELKRNTMVFEDGTIIVDKNKLYRVEKKEPYLLRLGRNTYQLYILDANTNAVYEFQDIDPNLKTGKINPVVLNPKTLYNYIASHSIQKLLGKITVSKGEAVLYMFTGMVIIIMLIFFILPLLGHSIIIK